MDVLIRKADKSVVQSWAGGVTGTVRHPDKPLGALTMGAGTKRPLDFDKYILVKAAENKAELPANSVYGTPVITVGADYSVVADWPIVAIPPPPTNVELANALTFRESVFKAFALVVLDEINLLRAAAGLSSRTVDQLKTAISNKM